MEKEPRLDKACTVVHCTIAHSKFSASIHFAVQHICERVAARTVSIWRPAWRVSTGVSLILASPSLSILVSYIERELRVYGLALPMPSSGSATPIFLRISVRLGRLGEQVGNGIFLFIFRVARERQGLQWVRLGTRLLADSAGLPFDVLRKVEGFGRP
ncbi:hypothetical protein EI94DRAFT_1180437 [Lactarius quietus]|nr:hypothetical protein EI94DRAFT_1180437 [Lactarius quietus]